MLLDKPGVGQVDAQAGLVLVARVEAVGAPHPEKERLLLVGLVERGGRKRNEREHPLHLLSFNGFSCVRSVEVATLPMAGLCLVCSREASAPEWDVSGLCRVART